MNVKQLKELLEGHKDETEVKLGGWKESSTSNTKYTYDYETLGEKNFAFDKNLEGKITILIESDV